MNDDHVFVAVVGMCLGYCSLTASPKRHLAAVCAVEYIALDTRRRLVARGDSIYDLPHETRKLVHCGDAWRSAHSTAFQAWPDLGCRSRANRSARKTLSKD